MPHNDDGRDVIELVVASGRSTPYYYKGDGTAAAFIRAGNETLHAPEHILNELVLKRTNRTANIHLFVHLARIERIFIRKEPLAAVKYHAALIPPALC